MASPQSLKTRLALMSKFEQLAARLSDGDESAVEDARECLVGIEMAATCSTMAMIFKALVAVLGDMQGEIDAAGFRYVTYEGHEPRNPE